MANRSTNKNRTKARKAAQKANRPKQKPNAGFTQHPLDRPGLALMCAAVGLSRNIINQKD